MKIEKIKISDLKPNPKNPRKSTPEQEDNLKKSLEKFGVVEPIVFNKRSGQIVGGHFRIRELKKMGVKEVDCVVVDLSPEDENELNIRLNSNTGDWDLDILQSDWEIEDLDNWGVDVEFGDLKIEATEDDFDVPDTDEIKTDIVLGDLFEIGEHRLLCGDSTDPKHVAKLMNDEIADMVFTSPPYNAGDNKNIPNSGGKKYKTYEDNKTEYEYFDFLCENIDAILPFTKEIFYNIGLIEKSKRSIIKILFRYIDIFKDIIYWNKSSVAPHIQPGIINNKIEFILCFGNGSRKFLNAQFSQGTYWNVIEGHNASNNDYAKVHKATFPIYLPNNILSNFSNIGSIIMDCFCGTGTTMVAAHQLNRRCYGMEFDPNYCDVIIRRMLNFDNSLKIKRNGKDETEKWLKKIEQ